MYIETSSPRRPGQKARLMSQLVNPSGAACVSFYYHMYGRNMGTLNVYVKEQSSSGSSSLGQPVWKRAGNQQNKWIVGQFSITPSQSFQVDTSFLTVFEPELKKGPYRFVVFQSPLFGLQTYIVLPPQGL